jgi:hypothetical protein
MLRWLLYLLVFLLAACGGGSVEEEEEGEAEVEATVMMHKSGTTVPLNVMEWGDSTAAGSRLPNGSSPSAQAQRVLGKWGYAYEVKHEAVGGMPAFFLTTGRHPLYRGVALEDFPSLAWADILAVRSGINELRTDQTQAMFEATLQEIVDVARSKNKPIILSTPSPLDPAIAGPASVAFVEASARTVRRVARANPDVAILCDQNNYAKLVGIVTWKLDGVHPNEEATVIEGRKFARCVLRATELMNKE